MRVVCQSLTQIIFTRSQAAVVNANIVEPRNCMHTILYQSKPVQGENVMQAAAYLLAYRLSLTVFSLVRPLFRPSAVLVVLDLLRDLAVIAERPCSTRRCCWGGCRAIVGLYEYGDGSVSGA